MRYLHSSLTLGSAAHRLASKGCPAILGSKQIWPHNTWAQNACPNRPKDCFGTIRILPLVTPFCFKGPNLRVSWMFEGYTYPKTGYVSAPQVRVTLGYGRLRLVVAHRGPDPRRAANGRTAAVRVRWGQRSNHRREMFCLRVCVFENALAMELPSPRYGHSQQRPDATWS